MKTSVVAAALLVCLCFGVPAAQARNQCSLDSFAGTYAFYERGSSAIFPAASETYPFHWTGDYAPFVTVGEVTMTPGGVGEGFYWIRVGSFNSGPDPVPVEIKVTEMNTDCTGKFQYDFNLFGSPMTIEERIVLFDNGREFRTIPISTGIPSVTWIGEGHRIRRSDEPLTTCGRQTARGSYLWSVENLVKFGPSAPIFSDVLLMRLDVAMNGDFTGQIFEKLGPLGPPGGVLPPATGTISVNPDCSFEMSLHLTVQGNPVTIPIRGVFYDQGKKLYGLQVSGGGGSGGTQYSFGEGQRIVP